MHFDGARQHIVHHHQSDVDASGLDAVQSIELGQQRAWILVQVLRGERQLTSKCSELKGKSLLLLSKWQHYVVMYFCGCRIPTVFVDQQQVFFFSFFFFFWLMCLLQSKLLEVGAKIGAGRPHEAPLSISPYSIQVAISGGTWPLCAGRF